MAKTILIVDDDKLIVALQRKLIQRLGYVDIAVAENAFEALHFLAEIEPDIVFLDIQMPGLDGWLLCEILHKVDRWAHIPVVLQSALVGADNIKKGLDLGAQSYLEKPFTQEGLKGVLEAVFHQDDAYTQDLDVAFQPVVMHLVDATKQVLNLIMGSQTRVIGVKAVDRANPPTTQWDMIGSIQLDGVVEINISMGWPTGLCREASKSLLVMEEDELTHELLQHSMNELMEMTAQTVTRSLSRIYPITPKQPSVHVNASFDIDRQHHYEYVIDMKAGQESLEVLVSMSTDDQPAE